MNQTDVYIRAFNMRKKVNIASKAKPEITEDIIKKWQKILNATADILDVPAGLIMKVTDKHMNVFVKSDNKANPYALNGKDALGHGLYCETVIGTDKPLEVTNALEDDQWKDNPDVKLNMIAYYGLPLKWKDDEVFGTICVLNDDTTKLHSKHKALLKLFQETIETDLHSLELIHTLNDLARIDPLTRIANRRHILEHLTSAYHIYKRNKTPFSIIMLDIDAFKAINDHYGHQEGDEVLKAFASNIKKRLRQTDSVGRLGGDEFLIVLNNTDNEGALLFIGDIIKAIKNNQVIKKHDVNFSYGVAVMSPKTTSPSDLVKQADHHMMDAKKTK